MSFVVFILRLSIKILIMKLEYSKDFSLKVFAPLPPQIPIHVGCFSKECILTHI